MYGFRVLIRWTGSARGSIRGHGGGRGYNPLRSPAQMPILRDFERRLEGLVEGFFAKAFRTGVQPVEFAKRILKEMEANRTVAVHDVWVPNRYVLWIGAADRERFQSAEQALAQELRQLVRDGAGERGWKLVGPAEVVFETDEKLGKGQFRCDAELVEGPDRPLTGQMAVVAPVAPGAGRARLNLLEDGRPTREYVLDAEVVTIGRSPECDVVVADPGVSRRHAEVRRENGGYMLSDLGSTNGTRVNEATVGERQLEEGDRISIGGIVLEFRSE